MITEVDIKILLQIINSIHFQINYLLKKSFKINHFSNHVVQTKILLFKISYLQHSHSLNLLFIESQNRRRKNIFIALSVLLFFQKLRLMPIIQLKPEHNHSKAKVIKIDNHIEGIKQNSNKNNQYNESIKNNVNTISNTKPLLSRFQEQPLLLISQNKQKRVKNSQKQKLIQQNTQLNIQSSVNSSIQLKQSAIVIDKAQQKQKKRQKILNVQVIKPQEQKWKLIKKSSIEPQSTIQNSKSKKKKKNKKKLLIVEVQLTPQQRLNIKTQQLYSSFMFKNKLKYNSYHPQMMTMLRQSFIPFAVNEIAYEAALRQSSQSQQQPIYSSNHHHHDHNKQSTTNFNRVNLYNTYLFDQLVLRKTFHEDRIYYGVLQQKQLFSDLIWRKEIESQVRKDEVAMLFDEIHMLVIDDVWEGVYQVHQKEKPSKDQVIYGKYKAEQIRLAETIIKQKLANLNDQFLINEDTNESSNSNNDESKFNSYKRFDLNSEETKKAEQFVKKMQEEQQAIRQRAKKARQLEQQQQRLRIQHQQQQKRKQQQQRIHERRIKLAQQAQQRQRHKQQRQQQHLLYQSYLTQHRSKTPLFKKKQQQLNQFLIKQRMRKFQILKQLQKSKRSISRDEIQLHQIKYKQLKQLLEEQRKEMMKLQQQQVEDNQITIYKSKFHQMAVGDLAEGKVKIENRKNKLQQLYSKRLQYATVVKTNFVPRVDTRKKEQLQRLISGLKPKHKDDRQIAVKTKMQGISNLQKLHLMLAEMKANGKIKQKQQTNSLQQIKSAQMKNKSRYINYLNEIKSQRLMDSSTVRRSRFSSLDSSRINRNSLGVVELQARNLEQSADRKSLFLKNTKNIDMEEYLQKKFQLEEDYVQSAKAKLNVLSKYELGMD